MPKDKKLRTQRNAIRTYIFDKRLGAMACAMVAVLSALIYFRQDLPILNFSSADPRRTAHNIPSGSILLPYDNGLCRLHAIDNATGKIQDDGVVNCLDAADQNTTAWKSLADQQRATEIRKSFRHE
ncbi:MAG TPA: hypothetical protein VHU22_09700 [Xanthobacteraceae bacterium]|jgi:hypothetical protein|nr:hypothetical protein [Xanthobacteraceae bacterium]